MTAIIIFALAAVFLGLRLYSVLGSRTGHDQGLSRPEETPLPSRPDIKPLAEARDVLTRGKPAEALAEDDAAFGLRAISSADRSFSLSDFIDGAQYAYRMILEGFWAGKLDEVTDFMAPDVSEAFAEAAKEREAAGEVVDNRLIAIERSHVTAASLTEGVARITVRFDADIAAVTRNADGAVIAGSLTDAITTHDVWTFERDTRSNDPNWTLVDTDEA